MRLLFVQYAGDYRETAQHLAANGSETYYAQKYSVDTVAEIGKTIEEVTVLCCITKEPYNEILQSGVRAIGAGFDKEIHINKLIKLIEEQKPTHLIVRTAIREVFRWAITNRVPTIATFAESISRRGLRGKISNFLLKKLLNNKQIEWVGAYGISSAVLFQEIGVEPDKIIPWNFIVTDTPDSFSPQKLSNSGKDWELFYIGSMAELKGVGDALEALAQLKAKNFPVKLKIAGRDEKDYFLNKAKQLKIEDSVKFLGLVPNSRVLPLMREADVVLVPSRHEYPEGFPLAITHALCARTPIIASDHPMFLSNLRDGVSAMIFAAANPIALSDCIEKLLSNPELYWTLSVESSEAWKRLQIPVKWADLIKRWLRNSPQDKQWLFEHRLSSGCYDMNMTREK